MMTADYFLEITQGPDRGQRFPVRNAVLVVGRSKHCDISLTDEGISRQHLEISLSPDSPGKFLVKDLKSRNGVFIRKQKINQAALNCGEIVQIGETSLTVQYTPVDKPGDGQGSGRTISLEERDTADTMIASIGVEKVELIPIDLKTSPHDVIEQRLQALYRLGEILAAMSSLEDKLAAVLHLICEVLPVEDGCILTRERETQTLVPTVAESITSTGPSRKIRISWTIINKCIDERIGIVAADALQDPRFDGSESVNIEKLHSVLSVPLYFHNNLWGVIFLTTSMQRGVFTEEELKFLTGIANKVAIIIEHHRLMQTHIERVNLAEVGELVASLSHYIKNILFAFSSAQILLDEALTENDYATVRSVWPILKDNAGHISDLVKDMLYFSKDHKPQKQYLQLNAIIEEVASLYRPTIQERGITFETRLDPAIPGCTIDPKSFHRVVLNLLKNAVDAMPEGKAGAAIRIESRFLAAADTVRLIVADSGIGIPPQNLERIFHYLFSTKGYEGTGIGLFVVKKIVEEHGGTITVDSTVNVGTTFTITLPLQSDEGPGP